MPGLLPTAIIVDIVGTLMNADKIVHLIRKEKKDWDEFINQLKDVKVDQATNQFIESFSEFHKIILVTEIPQKYQGEIVAWLEKHDIDYDQLIMPEKESVEDLDEEKIKAFEQKGSGNDIIIVLEEYPKCARKWARKGYKVWLTKIPDEDCIDNNRSDDMMKRLVTKQKEMYRDMRNTGYGDNFDVE